MIAADLFAGIGGFTLGAELAGCRVAWAANHWPAAVDAHRDNHTHTIHVCQDLQQADWTQVPPHDLLLASPACQGHSQARGKDRPHHDAQRATAWAVVTCAEAHRPTVVLVENVPEFASRWLLYPAWCAAMNALGYALAPVVVDAADHGVPQHRRRLFIVGTQSRAPIALKLPSHDHVPAASFVNFTSGAWTPINRPGRSGRTLARIASGRHHYGRRFLTPYYGSGSGMTGRSLDRPIGTITTRARWAVIDGDRMRMLTTDECRAGMGFPATYRLPQRHSLAVHMLGNAVCPPVARDLINALRTAL